MKIAEYYYTIDQASSEEFKDRGSKFIAYALPITDSVIFKKHLQSLKKEHPKAVHHCFAYRIGLNNDNFRVNDDGEPPGTAGKPILGQIDSRNLTNISVIVVRYFGGTLLGVPGLINAYKTATALVLQTIPVIQKQIEKVYLIQFDYTRLNDVMQILKQGNCTIIKQDMQLFCEIICGIPINKLERIIDQLTNLHGIELKAVD
ncbi:MAG: YigZ family protein [Ferruginibacter sp.]